MNKFFISIICFYVTVSVISLTAGRGFSQSPGSLTGDVVPHFEKSPCTVRIAEGVKAECGNLFVRESRQKAQSNIIRLPVVIIKSTSPNPALDPVIYTSGGPGVGSLGMAGWAGNLVPLTAGRDFIIFEQRGTRDAEPNLQCPEVNKALHANREKNLSFEKARQSEVQAAKFCHDRLIRQGVDLAAYDSVSSAADLEDLRKALKIGQWNLYGISYSTRLMLNYIRAYPENVRSVILDSVLPTTVNWDETGIDGVMRSLDLLFSDCRRQAACAAAHPQLEERFYALVKAADQKPFLVNAVVNNKTYPVKIDGAAIVDLLYNLLESTGALSNIPAIIDALDRGNYDALKYYAEHTLTSEGFIWGMRYSVWCREEMPFQSRRKIAAQNAKYPQLKGFGIQTALPEICRVWNVPPAAAIENQPVKSPIPALIMAGEYDPDTPPAWGKLVASWFPNSFFYEAKSTSHGAIGTPCTMVEITAAFVKNPRIKPASSCPSELPPIKFH